MIHQGKKYLWHNYFEERKELSDEGIELISIPWIEKEN